MAVIMNTRNTKRTVAETAGGRRARVAPNAAQTVAQPSAAPAPSARVTRRQQKVLKEAVEEVMDQMETIDGAEQQQQQHQVMEVIAHEVHQMDAQEVVAHIQQQQQHGSGQHMTTTIIQIIDDHNYDQSGGQELVAHVLEAPAMDDTQQALDADNDRAVDAGGDGCAAGGDDLANYWTIERSQTASDGRVDFVCKWMLCSFRTTSECSMRKHAVKHQKPYMCSFVGCGDRFTETQELLQHFSATHMDTNAFKCTFADCQQKFKDIKSLTAHRVSHVSHTTQLIKANKDYKPGGHRNRLPNDNLHHVYQLNDENLTATYEISGEGITMADGTQYYETTATSGGVSGGGDGKCEPYDRYRNNSRITSVIRCPISSLTDDIVEGNDNYVKCRSFDGKFWYKCLWDYCDYGNINEGIIRRHVLKHEFPHKCSFDGCSKSFTTISEMAEHRTVAHTGPNPYKCDWPECVDAFETLKVLTEHKTKHLSESSPVMNNTAIRVKKVKAPATPKPFVCDFGKCNMHYATPEELDAHKQIHSGDRPYKCQFPDCTFAAKSKDKLQIHHSRHSSVKQFRCLWPTCDKSFTISEQLRRHRKLHTNREQLICEFSGCDQLFHTADELEKHLRRHLGIEDSAFSALSPLGFKCNFGLCKMHFQTREELQRHSQSHRGQRMFKCGYDKCSYSAKTLDKLTAHLRYHSGERPFKCDFVGCHQDFIQSHHLARHRKSHFGGQQTPNKTDIASDDKPYDCEDCGQEFDDDMALVSHECPEGSSETEPKINSKSKVINHKRKLFVKEEEESDLDDSEVNTSPNRPKAARNASKTDETSGEATVYLGPKEYACSFGKCHFKGFTEEELCEHTERLHSGDRPFACDFQDCTFKAGRKDKLKIHMRRHTGDRPYKCEWNDCNRTFISKDNLNRHNLTHFRSKGSKANAIDTEFDRTLKELDDLLHESDEVVLPTTHDETAPPLEETTK
ncbi:unnamed protein product [Medioppia subpectinata]|uniref:C2H2-type domain-containing protein n=1 Tax=Medioppia subpectinata TaxID=1979941 RepID=A0A7R9KHE3_9ACAR|nr:unnamed protein product [Medioppia subpectinata]CAG2103414.1 unnamed protein product [Medioppia subpectinata]